MLQFRWLMECQVPVLLYGKICSGSAFSQYVPFSLFSLMSSHIHASSSPFRSSHRDGQDSQHVTYSKKNLMSFLGFCAQSSHGEGKHCTMNCQSCCFQPGSWHIRLEEILWALFANRKTQPGTSCDYHRVFLGKEFRIELRGFSPSLSKHGSCCF